MAEEKHCLQCGAELSASAPGGVCAKCVMKLGLPTGVDPEIPPVSDARGVVPTTTKPASGFIPPDPGQLGKTLPGLEVLELLGQGGMGAVYKARQRQLDRVVALKILPPEVGRDPAFAERFAREARSLARLNHPHIVTVYEFGRTEDGLFYIIMEFVNGTDLRHVIQAGRLGAGEALAIVPQICQALQYAHEEGVVHRDIKPENILLDKKGYVKIGDFGLAKLLDKTATPYTLTQAGQKMGTPHYMAPEQIEGAGEVDHRADIYSLGVVFYEMLTGQLPLGRFTPPSQKVHVDVRLDQVVLKTLEYEPARRYQHASEVQSDVESIAVDGVLPVSSGPTGAVDSDAPEPSLTAQSGSPVTEEEQGCMDAAQKRLQIPGIGLIIAGALGCLVPVFAMVMSVLGQVAVLELVISGLGVGVGLIVMAGALAMIKLRSHRLAVVSSIVAMLPLSPGCLLGLPIGIWSVIVLNSDTVQTAFAVKKRQLAATGKQRHVTSVMAVIGLIILVLVLLGSALLVPILMISSRESHRPRALITTRSNQSTQAPAQKIGDLDFPVGTWDYIDLGPAGPTLTDACAQTMDLKPSELLAVNSILQKAYQSYLDLEAAHTNMQHSGDHLEATIAPFREQALVFLEQLWQDLDAVLDSRKQAIARRHLPFGRMFGLVQFGEPKVTMTIEREDNAFNYEIAYQWPKASGKQGGGGKGRMPTLPPECQRFWDRAQIEE